MEKDVSGVNVLLLQLLQALLLRSARL